MRQLTDSEINLIKEAHGYIYHVVFKENIFQSWHDVTVFTLPQLITAFREGFDYKAELDPKPKRLYFRDMEVLLFYRVGLSEFVPLKDVPELALLLSYPSPNV